MFYEHPVCKTSQNHDIYGEEVVYRDVADFQNLLIKCNLQECIKGVIKREIYREGRAEEIEDRCKMTR